MENLIKQMGLLGAAANDAARALSKVNKLFPHKVVLGRSATLAWAKIHYGY